MTLRWRLGAYLVALHLALFGVTIYLFRQNFALFLGIELALLASLACGIFLVRGALRPLEYTARFRDLLEDEDYAARLVDSKLPELDELVRLFNTMLSTLYQERLALGEQRGFLDSLLEATPSAVVVFDYDGHISLMNASAHALLGLVDARGKPLSHWGNAGLLPQLNALPLGESRLLTDGEGRRYRAQRGQFHDRGFARHFLLVDELTAELESSERATYDKLIRVLAHEVNNTVAATGSVLDSLLFYQSQLTERDGADFSTAIVAVKRRNISLGEFIERFTRVIKMPQPELRPASVAAMMDDILWLNREQCKRLGIEIAWQQRDEVPLQRFDSHLMEQALLNIVKNAVEAVEASQAEGAAGGYIHFSLARQGDQVRLAITDSGNRLGELPARQLFTPFVSTKKGGQGIGLMFVREVLMRHAFPYRLAATGAGETQFEIFFTGTKRV
ncbi:PAS domain-containing sensor histidine kinase [Massilia sp. CF038]|uniref:sensor histidine kinase n=1 Tax=Massilia sp. CF038 TaxID=1881045 RepID=UPI00091C8C9F|nr:ATP-binding protein [Massilia sp. CF038]SHG57300.1 PAS domain-containing protein [Massilia sp. CF038]